ALGCGDQYDVWMDGRCFRMNYASSSFHDDAVFWCDSDGARLPAIKSEQENTDIFSALLRFNNFGSYAFWLGLSCDGEKFVWADGTEAKRRHLHSLFHRSILLRRQRSSVA
ncbi:hypothetical protein PFISCL1PPCAC_23481, partial [Pristionchus fissidentatus]